MTSDIRIRRWNGSEFFTIMNIKPSAVSWKCSVSDLADTCTVTLPLSTYVVDRSEHDTEASKAAGYGENEKTYFKEGDRIDVALGYDTQDKMRFQGFIRRINYGNPLQLECEGYTYELKDIIFNKTYTQTTLRQILEDLTQTTLIQLSDRIPHVPIRNVTFKNTPGIKVLEWAQKELLCAVYFRFDRLYAGASKFDGLDLTQEGTRQPVRVGWNTLEAKELKKVVPDEKVQINLVEKDSAGSVKKTKSEQRRYSSIKEVKIRAGLPADFLKKVADELQKAENFSGYGGKLSCFLEPYFEKGYVAELEDTRFPDRNGSYFVETIEGRFDGQQGGRQNLVLRYFDK